MVCQSSMALCTLCVLCVWEGEGVVPQALPLCIPCLILVGRWGGGDKLSGQGITPFSLP